MIILNDVYLFVTLKREGKYFSNLLLVKSNVNTIPGHVDWFKVLKEQLLFYPVELKSTLMMLFIQLNLSKIFLVSRIFVEMDITLKLWMMIVMNTFSLLQLFMGKNTSWKSFLLILVGYTKQLLNPWSHMLSWTRSSMT